MSLGCSDQGFQKMPMNCGEIIATASRDGRAIDPTPSQIPPNLRAILPVAFAKLLREISLLAQHDGVVHHHHERDHATIPHQVFMVRVRPTKIKVRPRYNGLREY